MRSAVLANARSRVCFQLAHEDARMMAAGNGQLTAEDFFGLGRFEVYAAVLAAGSVQPWCSLRTDAPRPATSHPAAVRAASRQQYGAKRQAIETELAQLLAGPGRLTDDLSPRKRSAGGRS
jgi:hypothetical protein